MTRYLVMRHAPLIARDGHAERDALWHRRWIVSVAGRHYTLASALGRAIHLRRRARRDYGGPVAFWIVIAGARAHRRTEVTS